MSGSKSPKYHHYSHKYAPCADVCVCVRGSAHADSWQCTYIYLSICRDDEGKLEASSPFLSNNNSSTACGTTHHGLQGNITIAHHTKLQQCCSNSPHTSIVQNNNHFPLKSSVSITVFTQVALAQKCVFCEWKSPNDSSVNCSNSYWRCYDSFIALIHLQ